MLSRARWVPVWFLFAGGMINYMDRAAVSVAAPFLMKDLGLNAAQLGIVFSSFFAGYALFTFAGGYAADQLGPKRVFTLAMTVWSVFCGLTAAATGFVSLLIVRVAFGCGEGPFGTITNKMVRNWFPRRQAATAIGIANAGSPIGGALAGPVAGWLTLRYGWRVCFVALAALGLLWAVFWVVSVSDHPPNTDAANEAQHEVRTTDESGLPLRFYLRQPTTIATALAFFGYAYVLYFFLSWFPTYLTVARKLSVRDMVWVNSIPWVLGTVGLAMSGFACDALARRTGDLLRARRAVLVVCLIAAAGCVALAGIVAQLAVTVFFMTAAIFAVYLTGATYWAIIQETVPDQHLGATGGFVHLIANCAGVVGPAVTGYIVQTTGVFTSAFLLAGAFALLGAALVSIYVKRV